MNSKNVLGWIVLATWIFSWCTNNNEVNEINETITDNITIIKDSINKDLMEIINQNTHNYRKKFIRHHKIPLIDENNNLVKTTKNENKDSTNDRRNKLVNMYEAWLEDGDEMKKYKEQNSDYEYYNWRFIADDSEREDNQKIQDYDPNEDYLFVRKIK